MKHTETIQKYLRKEMAETEKIAFEALLKNDKRLQEEYAFHLQLFDSLQKRQKQEKEHENKAKNWVNELEFVAEKKQNKGSLPVWGQYAVAACMIIALSAGMYQYLSKSNIPPSVVVNNTDTIAKDTAPQIVDLPKTTQEVLIPTPKQTQPPNIPTPSKPKTSSNLGDIDNSAQLATLQQIIDIKKEIRGYQDSIEALIGKKIVGFSGTNSAKIQWQDEETLLINYKKQQKNPIQSEILEWEKQRANLLAELSANKELWNKYKQRK